MQNADKNPKSRKLFPQFHMEVDKLGSTIAVSVGLVSSVIDISSKAVILKLKHRKIKVVGEELTVTVYENRIAEISGRVGVIEFL